MLTLTRWSNLLNLLRPKLLGRRDGRYVIVSLRWLEAAMLERGIEMAECHSSAIIHCYGPSQKPSLACKPL